MCRTIVRGDMGNKRIMADCKHQAVLYLHHQDRFIGSESMRPSYNGFKTSVRFPL
jgi:hypothetical protein